MWTLHTDLSCWFLMAYISLFWVSTLRLFCQKVTESKDIHATSFLPLFGPISVLAIKGEHVVWKRSKWSSLRSRIEGRSEIMIHKMVYKLTTKRVGLFRNKCNWQGNLRQNIWMGTVMNQLRLKLPHSKCKIESLKSKIYTSSIQMGSKRSMGSIWSCFRIKFSCCWDIMEPERPQLFPC